MFQAKSSAEALPGRMLTKSPGNGAERWRTDFLGIHGTGKVGAEPQAFLVEMQSNDEIQPHFHEVDQFQVFVAGSGGMGRGEAIQPVTIHYADRYTGYGPIFSGPQGYSYFTLRARTDSSPIYLHHADYREKLKPSQKRHGSSQAALSTTPVLMHRTAATCETVMGGPQQYSDGLAAFMLRAGADMPMSRCDPRDSDGQFYLVLNGSLEMKGKSYPAWSTIFVGPDEAVPEARAEAQGCEALVLQFGIQKI